MCKREGIVSQAYASKGAGYKDLMDNKMACESVHTGLHLNLRTESQSKATQANRTRYVNNFIFHVLNFILQVGVAWGFTGQYEKTKVDGKEK